MEALVRLRLPAVIAIVAAVAVFRLSSSPSTHLATLAVGGIAVVMAVPALARHPTLCVCILLALFALLVPALGWLYTHGLPGSVAHQLGGLKDLMTLSLAFRAFRDRPLRESSTPDRFLFGYLAVASAYILLPYLDPSLAQLPLNQRGLAWRTDCTWVVVFLALRRIDRAAFNLVAIRTTILALSALVAGIALFEYLQPETWRAFYYNTLGVERYNTNVLLSPDLTSSQIRRGLNGTVRSKSLISDPVFCAFYLLPGLLLSLTRIPSRRWWLSTPLTALILVGIFTTQTRAALIAGLIGMAVASVMVLRSGRVISRYLAPVLAAALIVSPVVVAGTPVLARVSQAVQGQDASAQGHQADIQRGINAAFAHPLGLGLGTGAGVGQRFDVSGGIISENAYISVVNELGVLAFVAFVGFLVSMLFELRRSSRERDSPFLDRVTALALLVAMAIGGVFQQVWYDFSVSVLVGVVLALPLLSRTALPAPERVLTWDAADGRDADLVTTVEPW